MAIEFDNGLHGLEPQRFAWPKDMPFRSIEHSSPFEDLGAELVRELARVGWEVPGIDLRFMTTGSGTKVVRSLYGVSGETPAGPFWLRFGNRQGEDGTRYGCLTGLSEACIPPGLSVTHWSDTGDMSATLYLTEDWARDGAALRGIPHVNPKLEGEPKRYLAYKAKRRASMFKHDDDLGREYSPEGSEPRHLSVAETVLVVREFVQSLVDRLSAMPSAPGCEDITAHGDANLRRLAHVPRIPAPSRFPKLYAWADRNTVGRVNGWGDVDPEEADFVLSGGGLRLCPLTGVDFGQIPPRATDGFVYATVDPDDHARHPERDSDPELLPVEIDLKWLNEVYVADGSAYRRTRDPIVEAGTAAGRDRFTPEEMRRIGGAVARTMVPVVDYEGGYAEPLYLIGRQLRSDEARVMRGPVELRVDTGRIEVRMTDTVSGRVSTLMSTDKVIPLYHGVASRIARDAAYYLNDRDPYYAEHGTMPDFPTPPHPGLPLL